MQRRANRARLELTALEARTVPTATVTAETIRDAVEGGQTGIIRLTRTGDTSGGLMVSVVICGTANTRS